MGVIPTFFCIADFEDQFHVLRIPEPTGQPSAIHGCQSGLEKCFSQNQSPHSPQSSSAGASHGSSQRETAWQVVGWGALLSVMLPSMFRFGLGGVHASISVSGVFEMGVALSLLQSGLPIGDDVHRL
jgi:hypothetical protein